MIIIQCQKNYFDSDRSNQIKWFLTTCIKQSKYFHNRTLLLVFMSVLQIRRGNRVNFGIIFHIKKHYIVTPNQKHLPNIVLLNGHNMFSLRNKN